MHRRFYDPDGNPGDKLGNINLFYNRMKRAIASKEREMARFHRDELTTAVFISPEHQAKRLRFTRARDEAYTIAHECYCKALGIPDIHSATADPVTDTAGPDPFAGPDPSRRLPDRDDVFYSDGLGGVYRDDDPDPIRSTGSK